jgi:hypothetical protein
MLVLEVHNIQNQVTVLVVIEERKLGFSKLFDSSCWNVAVWIAYVLVELQWPQLEPCVRKWLFVSTLMLC